ncbi:MAG: VWA domain-containing protein [Deltaproteobacteria bacterium]|nr:VWA domain-containing protein [Deltaproteobacteria bacterium]
MKVFAYQPGRGADLTPEYLSEIPLAALADSLFEYESLEEALQHFQREGAAGRDGKVMTGIKGLLEELRGLKDDTNNGGGTDDSVVDELIAELPEQLPYNSGDSGPRHTGTSVSCEGAPVAARITKASLDRDGSRPLLDGVSLLSGKLQKMERLEKELKRVSWGFDMESVDEALLDEILGSSGVERWRAIKTLPARLVKAGFAERSRTGLQLTHVGLQKVAWSILRELFRPRKPDRRLQRTSVSFATEPFLTEGTRPYQFGDHLEIDTARSLLNAIKRSGPGERIRLGEDDFEVYEKEPVVRTATVVLLDISKSMRFGGRFSGAKKVALALNALVRKRYPRDRITVVAFSSHAEIVKQHELPFLAWDPTNPYTNIEEAFHVGRHILAGCKGYRQQLFLITDGEPTAHREQGNLFFQFPPHRRTLIKTLAATDRLVRQKIALSVFLLADEKDNVAFMHDMTRRAGGKLFLLQPDNLGKCLLMDYVKKKQKQL